MGRVTRARSGRRRIEARPGPTDQPLERKVYGVVRPEREEASVEEYRQVFGEQEGERVRSGNKCPRERSGQMFKGRETDGRDINPSSSSSTNQ
ncbi:hypothetical protein E2C01_099460 [Portunus trituberculatus]|uniref:Uncharacterized protein n=1 Tax=Portunus trituberculatus TaxID=210409 RepID=A0A5B7KAF5_PORTR|nr:hypothetical protein [Portunus trituberculatus]